VTTPTGTGPAVSFRSRVLECVGQIPPGRVMSYGDVAACVGTRAARAVGQILAQSDDGIPWHRVVRADGSMADPVRATQIRLLAAEGVPVEGERVVMEWAAWSAPTRRGAADDHLPTGFSGSGPP
jgi:methylated-DNA-protein-cysteine methyltransferase related protein